MTSQHSVPGRAAPAGAAGEPPLPREVDAAIRAASDPEASGQPVERRVLALAAIANRALAQLFSLARNEASRRRGMPEWGRWAALQNAAREAVLGAGNARQRAQELAQLQKHSEGTEGT